MEQATSMGEDFKGITATRKELRESGYFYEAKLIVLRNLAGEEGFTRLGRRGSHAWENVLIRIRGF